MGRRRADDTGPRRDTYVSFRVEPDEWDELQLASVELSRREGRLVTLTSWARPAVLARAREILAGDPPKKPRKKRG